MAEAKFVLKYPKADKETVVFLKVYYNYKQVKYSTGEKIHPKFWNEKKQRARETREFINYHEFNQRLNKIEQSAHNAFRRLLNNDEQVTPEAMKRELDVELNRVERKKQIEPLEWIENEIEIQKTLKKATSIVVYEGVLQHLKNFSIAYKYKITWDSINLVFYEKFQDYITNELKLTNNTFGKQIKVLKVFLNLATEKGVNKNLEYKSRMFKVLQEDIDHVYLTEDELDTIYFLDLNNNERLDKVRDVFLIGCHTGLRFSDFTQLKQENFTVLNGRNVFNVKTDKTDARVMIPLKPAVIAIYRKYNGEFPRALSNQRMNDYIKEVCELAGIKNEVTIRKTHGKEKIEYIRPKFQFVSTHTARRSFATNAYLKGVPTIGIMKITGHKTEKAFMRYIKVSQEENAMMLSNHEFFKREPKQQAI